MNNDAKISIMKAIELECNDKRIRNALEAQIDRFVKRVESSQSDNAIRVLFDRTEEARVQKGLKLSRIEPLIEYSETSIRVLNSIDAAGLNAIEQIFAVKNVDECLLLDFCKLHLPLGNKNLYDHLVFRPYPESRLIVKFFFSYFLTQISLNEFIQVLLESEKCINRDKNDRLSFEQLFKIVKAVKNDQQNYPIDWIVSIA